MGGPCCDTAKVAKLNNVFSFEAQELLCNSGCQQSKSEEEATFCANRNEPTLSPACDATQARVHEQRVGDLVTSSGAAKLQSEFSSVFNSSPVLRG